MNKFILTLFLTSIFTFSNFAQDSIDDLALKDVVHINWEASFKQALKKSKKEKKPILIYFTGSDWCTPCKILDKKLFHTEKFKELADKDLILYEADNPRNRDLLTEEKSKQNIKLQRKYKVKSFPTLVMVNHKGQMIGYKKGLILTEYYYPFLQSVIENY